MSQNVAGWQRRACWLCIAPIVAVAGCGDGGDDGDSTPLCPAMYVPAVIVGVVSSFDGKPLKKPLTVRLVGDDGVTEDLVPEFSTVAPPNADQSGYGYKSDVRRPTLRTAEVQVTSPDLPGQVYRDRVEYAANDICHLNGDSASVSVPIRSDLTQ